MKKQSSQTNCEHNRNSINDHEWGVGTLWGSFIKVHLNCYLSPNILKYYTQTFGWGKFWQSSLNDSDLKISPPNVLGSWASTSSKWHNCLHGASTDTQELFLTISKTRWVMRSPLMRQFRVNAWCITTHLGGGR